MATCLNCNGSIDATARTCPHCGYDFPLQPPVKPERSGLAYSGFANLSLFLSMIFVTLGALSMLALMVVSLFAADFLRAVVAIPSFFIFVALYVVFQRAADMDC